VASIQDSKKGKLATALGSTYPVDQMWHDWLESVTTGTSATTNGLEELYLDEELIAAGNLNDRWYKWLGTAPRSHTGSLQLRWQKYWES